MKYVGEVITTSTSTPTTCVFYLRQSKDAAGDGKAVDRQREASLRHAATRGWTVVGEYVDNDTSASTRRPRPAFERMMTDAKDGKFDITLAWQLDRLTRRVTEIERIIELSEATGVKFATVSGDLDLTTDQGRLIGRILGSVARGEVERKSTRQRLADTQRATDGKLPSARSFGYVGAELHPIEAEALRRAYSALLAGESLVSITKVFNAQGFTGKSGQQLDRMVVRGILANPKNAGLRGFRGEVMGQGAWPAIVPEHVWRAAVTLMNQPDRRKNEGVGTTRRWVGSGLYRCGRCGSDVKVAATGGKGGGHGYRCRASTHFTTAFGGDIDELVESQVAARLARPDAAGLLPDINGAAVQAARTELEALSLREDQIGLDRADGVLTARQVAVANQRLTERRTTLTGELAALLSESALGSILAAANPGREFLSAPVTVRQKIIAALLEVTLLPVTPGARGFDPGKVQVTWRAES